MRTSMRRSATSSTAIRTLKPTAIIGVAAVGGTFTHEVLRSMAQLNERPIVFALSNPTSKAECTAEEAYRYTDGRALFACGSPFDPVTLNGKTFVPRQGNNSYIFPGVGLGAIASRRAARHRRDVHGARARTLAELVSEADLAQGSLYPALPRIREVSAHIAARVAESPTSGASRPKRRRPTCSPMSRATCTSRATDRQPSLASGENDMPSSKFPAPRRRPPRVHLYVQVLAAITIGVLLGHFYPHLGEQMKPLGDGFIKLIKMLIAPIIFCTVVHGIASMEDLKKVGRIGLKALIYFELVTTLALVVGLVIVNVVQPGAGMNIDRDDPRHGGDRGLAAKAEQHEHGRLPDAHHPDTIVGAFAEGEILQVLFFAVLFGFAVASWASAASRCST